VRRVALTGGIATGKSVVRKEFERLGVPTVDADLLARDAVAPGTPGLKAVTTRFGDTVITSAGTLDRKALAAIVFSDQQARLDLEAIIHPIVRSATDAWFIGLPDAQPFAIADIPLLYEVGRDRDFDAVIVAACDPGAQVRRVMARDGVTEDHARRRIAAQWPIADKVARADHVIDTNGTLDDTARQVRDLVATLGRT